MFLQNEKWFESVSLSDLADLRSNIEQLILADWEAGKEEADNRGLRILKDIMEKDSRTEKEEQIVYYALSRVAKEEPVKTFNILWKYIEKDKDLSKKIVNHNARTSLIDMAETLAENKHASQALAIIDKLINDPDPRVDEPDDKLNYHKRVLEGQDRLVITSVRGKIPWALQKITLIPDCLSAVSDRVERLAKDENLYVRLQATVPLIELVKRRKLAKNKTFERKARELAFSMLNENKKYPVILKYLVKVFMNLKDVQEEEARTILETLKEIPDAAPLFIYFALFRKRHFPELPKFNPEYFEKLLERQVSKGTEEIRGNIIWQFRMILKGAKEHYEEIYPYIEASMSEETEFSKRVHESFLTLMKHTFKLNPLGNSKLFLKHLSQEKDFVAANKEEAGFNIWRDYKEIFAHIFELDKEMFLDALEILTSYLARGVIIYDLGEIAGLLKQITEKKYSKRVRFIFERLEAYNLVFYDLRKRWEESQ